jgi:YgiT-type zinc finger domain-containing protein
MCKGAVEDKLAAFMTELDNCIVIVKNVPSQVCTQCGERSYSDEVARQLEKIVQSVTKPGATEITVVSYRKQVA